MPEQSFEVLSIFTMVVVCCNEELICMGRTLLNSSNERVVRTDDTDEQTVSGCVVTVVFEDTENDGVTIPFCVAVFCFFDVQSPALSSPNNERRFLLCFNADRLTLQIGEMATSRCILSSNLIDTDDLVLSGLSPKRTLAMHKRG